MFISKRRIIALFVVLSMVIIPAQISVAKSDGTSLVYTAIGDAIALGVGGEYQSAEVFKGYDDYVYEKLQSQYQEGSVVLHNVSGRLDTSSDLLNRLKFDSTIINAVDNADIISVSVGANNLILPVWPIFQQMFGGLISVENAYGQIFGSTAAFQVGVDQFKADWIQIIEQLKILSPDAQITVTTMYNPFSLNDPLYGLADIYINQINAEIKDKSFKHDYNVADVYSAFYKYEAKALSKDYIIEGGYIPRIHQYPSYDVVHPTPAGYEMISDLFKIKKVKSTNSVIIDSIDMFYDLVS